MSAGVIAWCVLLVICFVVVLVACVVISSSLAFFSEEASKVASKLDDAPQLRSIVEQTARFASSFIWMIFMLLVLTLGVCLVVLWIESLVVRWAEGLRRTEPTLV